LRLLRRHLFSCPATIEIPILRRSGWAGHESALPDHDIEDIDAWMAYLLQRGVTISFSRLIMHGSAYVI
jgi:hypothetical protein